MSKFLVTYTDTGELAHGMVRGSVSEKAYQTIVYADDKEQARLYFSQDIDEQYSLCIEEIRPL